MNIRFRLLTMLRIINTKPPRSRDGAALLVVKRAMLAASALLFFIASITSFTRVRDAEGIAYLVLTLVCAMGGLGYGRLFRRQAVSTIFCAFIALSIACMTIWGKSGTFMSLWALFFPIIAMGIGGIRSGALIGGLLAAFYMILFWTPLLKLIPAAYPVEISRNYPLLYLLDELICFTYFYMSHKQRLLRQDNEEMLEKAVQTEHDHLMIMMTQTILSISNAVDARDTYTQRHSARVAEYSVMLAKALDWDSARLDQPYSIALLHDIGKIGISDSILNKHGALTSEEREVIKQHTVIGGEILKDLTLLPNASIGAVSHHERYDGTGYPYGLKGRQIPLEARIIGIADAFDAMNSSRVYRARIAPKTIMQELRKGRGCQFDPELLDTFLPIAEGILLKDEV